MDRYDERTPLWDYSNNANPDDRSWSDYRWDRARAEQAARAYVAAEEEDGPARRPRGDGRRAADERGDYRRSESRRRGYGDEADNGRYEPRDYYGYPEAPRDAGRRWSFWPSEFGYPASRGYSPYSGLTPSALTGRDERGFFDRAGDEILSWFGDRDARRRRERDHRGRGPKNYVRADERISDDVHDRLTEDVWLDASDIEVAVADGEVTLSGHVEDRRSKRRAEDLADDVAGVKHVQNNLRYHSGVVSPQLEG